MRMKHSKEEKFKHKRVEEVAKQCRGTILDSVTEIASTCRLGNKGRRRE